MDAVRHVPVDADESPGPYTLIVHMGLGHTARVGGLSTIYAACEQAELYAFAWQWELLDAWDRPVPGGEWRIRRHLAAEEDGWH